jgi:hypothetical protein
MKSGFSSPYQASIALAIGNWVKGLAFTDRTVIVIFLECHPPGTVSKDPFPLDRSNERYLKDWVWILSQSPSAILLGAAAFALVRSLKNVTMVFGRVQALSRTKSLPCWPDCIRHLFKRSSVHPAFEPIACIVDDGLVPQRPGMIPLRGSPRSQGRSISPKPIMRPSFVIGPAMNPISWCSARPAESP